MYGHEYQLEQYKQIIPSPTGRGGKWDSSESDPNGTYLKIFATEAHRITRKKNALLIEYFRVILCASVAK